MLDNIYLVLDAKLRNFRNFKYVILTNCRAECLKIQWIAINLFAKALRQGKINEPSP